MERNLPFEKGDVLYMMSGAAAMTAVLYFALLG